MSPWNKPGRCEFCGKPYDDHRLDKSPPLCPPPFTPKQAI